MILKCLVVKFSIDFSSCELQSRSGGPPQCPSSLIWMNSSPVTPSSNNAKMLSILATPSQMYSFTEVPDSMVMESCTYGAPHTLPQQHHKWFQFCMPCKNIHTTVRSKAYLNKTDYHTVKHHSWRICNILYTVKPYDVTKSVHEELKRDR